MPPSDFGYLELYKYSPRTSQGARSAMDNSMYKTDSKFHTIRGGISQNSTRANTFFKSRNAARTSSMMDNYPSSTPKAEPQQASKSEVHIEQMNQTIS